MKRPIPLTAIPAGTGTSAPSGSPAVTPGSAGSSPSPGIPIERHPLPPFIPEGARILMLGSFPPDRRRWSMEFYYPNFQNDMWRIMGIIFHNDKDYFTDIPGQPSIGSSGTATSGTALPITPTSPRPAKFDLPSIIHFLTTQGIAIYDTATAIRRLSGTASDAQLEIVESTDLAALLNQIPHCRTIISTGGKSAEEVAAILGCPIPRTGTCIETTFAGRPLRFYRMPSSSRAYPMPLERKANLYRSAFGK